MSQLMDSPSRLTKPLALSMIDQTAGGCAGFTASRIWQVSISKPHQLNRIYMDVGVKHF